MTLERRLGSNNDETYSAAHVLQVKSKFSSYALFHFRQKAMERIKLYAISIHRNEFSRGRFTLDLIHVSFHKKGFFHFAGADEKQRNPFKPSLFAKNWHHLFFVEASK